MKSFSSSVKEYLCEKSLEELVAREHAKGKWKECCRRAFLRSVFLTLAKEEEDELCRRLQVAVACYPEEGSAAFRAYLLPLREHFNEKIMSYVQRHLHEFE